MRRTRIILLLLLLPAVTGAPQRDFATELQASYGLKPWRSGSMTLSEKVRFTDNSSRYCQSKTAVVVQQTLLKRQLDLYDLRLRIGGGYTFINRLSDPYENPYYENQHRLMVQSTLAYSYGFWRFGGRVRMQGTFRDESRGDYRYNPKLALRGRLSASYAMPNKPWKFGAHAEYFYRLNDPRGSFIDEMRYTVEITRIIDRRQSITLYGKYFHELQVAEPLRMFALGISYQFDNQ